MNQKTAFFSPAGLPRLRARASPEMEDPQLLKWQAQLDEAKADLAQLGPMRPGSLSQQYRDPLTKVGAFWQLSYTHNMRSRSRHIRADELALIRPLVSNFKRFRLLVDRCVDLSVKIADRQTELRRAASVKES
jgi:hypothetical protein